MWELFVYKFGLKVWSVNKDYFKDIVRLWNNNVFQYIELFAVPGSYDDCINSWKSLDIPFVIHAPHTFAGLNLSKREFLNENLRLAEETFRFADELKSKIIIFHPGIDGDIYETIFQLNKIKDERIVIENKPYYALKSNMICNGHSAEEINFIMNEAGVGFCLDIGHAIYSANAKNINSICYIKEFLKLRPKMFHLGDGDFCGVYDSHKNIGKGNFNFNKILQMISDGAYVSIETDKNFKDSLIDFEQDVRRLREIETNAKNKKLGGINL